MRILIFADSRWRDVFGHVLVKRAMPQHEVQIISFDLWQDALKLFKPHVVVLNHMMGQRNNEIADYVKRQGGLVVVLPSEGRPNSENQHAWFVSQQSNPNLDLFLSWNHLAQPRKNVVVTGCPRFAIYGEYKDMIESKIVFADKWRLDADRPIVAVTSSFPQAKFAYAGVKFNKEDWKDLSVTSIMERDDPESFAQLERAYLKKFRFWLKVIQDQSPPRYQFVVKPHPMEDVNDWERFCTENGFTLLRQEHIENLLNASDLLVARHGCLTVLEGWLMGLPTIQLGLGSERTGAAEEAFQLSWNVQDTYDIVSGYANRLLQDLERSDNMEEYRQKYMEKYGLNQTGSAERIAEAIETLIGLNWPRLVSDPTSAERRALQFILVQHTTQNFYPNPQAFHLGKSVTQLHVQEWSRALDRREALL